MGDICDMAAGMFSVKNMGLMMIAPELRKKKYRSFFGCQLTSAGSKAEFYGPGGEFIAEMALMLSSYESGVVVAVEVDRILHINNVEWHIEYLKRMREHERVTLIEGKTMYAAVAGVYIHDGVHDLALRSGMCVLEIDKDTEKVRVVMPKELAVW